MSSWCGTGRENEGVPPEGTGRMGWNSGRQTSGTNIRRIAEREESVFNGKETSQRTRIRLEEDKVGPTTGPLVP